MLLCEMKAEEMKTEILQKIFKKKPCEMRWDEALRPYTSLKVGGPADLMCFPRSVEELRMLIKIISAQQLPYCVLGNGSNLLVKDGGIEDIVIHLKHFNTIEVLEKNRLKASAGLAYPKLALYAMEQCLSGLEFAAGIPGTVGGAVVMNAGVPQWETAACLASITLLDESGNLKDIPATKIKFNYRNTRLPKGIVISAVFALSPASKSEISARMKTTLKRRQETQPLNFSNCGSVFKNPAGHHAGALIEAAGLKGLKIGDAEISERHGNFIINRGEATAKDCLALIREMKAAVADLYGIALELEVKVVGRD